MPELVLNAASRFPWDTGVQFVQLLIQASILHGDYRLSRWRDGFNFTFNEVLPRL